MKKLLVSLICMFSMQAYAQNTNNYITEGGSGTLIVEPNNLKSSKFKIDVFGSNGHSCAVDGTMKNGLAVLKEEGETEQCTINFKQVGNIITVIAKGDSCHYYCGARAWFEDDYINVTKQCLESEVDKSRKSLLKFYKEKKYVEALAQLEPVMNNCAKTIHWTELAWIRNDLAITYAKLGKFEDCSKVLEPLKADAKLSEEQIKEDYPPVEALTYLPILKATRTNLKICKVK